MGAVTKRISVLSSCGVVTQGSTTTELSVGSVDTAVDDICIRVLARSAVEDVAGRGPRAV